jgi:hypothetical protein
VLTALPQRQVPGLETLVVEYPRLDGVQASGLVDLMSGLLPWGSTLKELHLITSEGARLFELLTWELGEDALGLEVLHVRGREGTEKVLGPLSGPAGSNLRRLVLRQNVPFSYDDMMDFAWAFKRGAFPRLVEARFEGGNPLDDDICAWIRTQMERRRYQWCTS